MRAYFYFLFINDRKKPRGNFVYNFISQSSKMSLLSSSYRKTKKGSIIKTISEIYLREDIHCGKNSCQPCKKFKLDSDDKFAPPSYLSDNPRVNLNNNYPEAHYVVPDYHTILYQIDVLADEKFGHDIIILQTVFKSIKENINIYMKLKELLMSGRFYLFHNEFCKYTFR